MYIQDDWKATPRLTVNLGLRAENQSPYLERHDNQANFYPTLGITYNPAIGQQGQSSSAGVYVLPEKSMSAPLPATFLAVLQKDNIAIKYSSNRYLLDYPLLNWGPRIGLSYKLDERSVIRAGFGIYYGGLESVGFAPNLGLNYPFTQRPSLTNSGNLPCIYSNGCLTDGINLATGYTEFIANGGLSSFVGTPSVNGIANNPKTPYTYQFNLSFEHQIGNFTGVNNLSQNAILIGNPFAGGGTPDPSLNFPAGATCPAKVRTLASWFNPCAFKNPLPGSAVTGAITLA